MPVNAELSQPWLLHSDSGQILVRIEGSDIFHFPLICIFHLIPGEGRKRSLRNAPGKSVFLAPVAAVQDHRTYEWPDAGKPGCCPGIAGDRVPDQVVIHDKTNGTAAASVQFSKCEQDESMPCVIVIRYFPNPAGSHVPLPSRIWYRSIRNIW
jgi:hypothetical protein